MWYVPKLGAFTFYSERAIRRARNGRKGGVRSHSRARARPWNSRGVRVKVIDRFEDRRGNREWKNCGKKTQMLSHQNTKDYYPFTRGSPNGH